MPYKSISDLPSSVRNSLPVGAQKLWMSAYNYASANPSKIRGEPAQYAWGAVKRVYKKTGDRWVKKNSIDLAGAEDWMYDWIIESVEELQLQTSDIVDILPKRFWEVPVKQAVRLDPHLGKLLWEGAKTSITTYEDWSGLMMKPLHLIEDTVSYGTIRLKEMKKMKDPDEEYFVYEVDWLKKFPGPLPVRLRRHDKSRNRPYSMERNQYSFIRLDNLSNQDLLWMHSYCHTGHNSTIKEFHDLVAGEITRRGMLHPIYSPLDQDPAPDSAEWKDVHTDGGVVYTDGIGSEGEITMEDFLSALPEQFSIDEPPAQIWLTGDIVKNGSIKSNEVIDIIVRQDSPDMRIPSKLVRELKDIPYVRVHPIFTPDEPEGAIPIYRTSYQKTITRSLSENATIRRMVPKTTEFTNIQDMWENWISTRIDNGVIVHKKYSGISVLLRHMKTQSDGLYRADGLKYEEYDSIDQYPNIKEELSRIDRPFIAMGDIVCYNCNNIVVNDKEELCTPIHPSDTHKVANDSNVVFHVNELISLDGESVHHLPYNARMLMMNYLLPEGSVHIRAIPYVLCNTPAALQRAVETLGVSPGINGLILREHTSTYVPSGKSTQLADLSKGHEGEITLDRCKYVGANVCPLKDPSNIPTQCTIASLSRCPFLKESVYDPKCTKIELRNWKLLESVQD